VPSAKSARVGDRKKERNQPLRTKARTFVTRTRRLIDSGDIEGAEGSARVAIAALDRAAQKGVIHENNASRRKSRLIKSLNKAKIGQE
jgi:small subunit ribosomal protein S20